MKMTRRQKRMKRGKIRTKRNEWRYGEHSAGLKMREI
jgi:hypothetical protein